MPLGHDAARQLRELMEREPDLSDSELGRAVRRVCSTGTIRWGELEKKLARTILAQRTKRRNPK
jgi:hypothetical protein